MSTPTLVENSVFTRRVLLPSFTKMTSLNLSNKNNQTNVERDNVYIQSRGCIHLSGQIFRNDGALEISMRRFLKQINACPICAINLYYIGNGGNPAFTLLHEDGRATFIRDRPVHFGHISNMIPRKKYLYMNREYYVTFDRDFTISLTPGYNIGLFCDEGVISFTTSCYDRQVLSAFLRDIRADEYGNTMIRQGLTKHELSRNVKPEKKRVPTNIAGLLPDKEQIMVGDIFDKNLSLPFDEWRKPKGMTENTLKKIHNQRGFMLRKTGVNINPTNVEGRDKLKGVVCDDLNMEKAYSKLTKQYVKVPVRNQIGITLPHKYEFSRTSNENREIVTWKSSIGVKAGAGFSLPANRLLTCHACETILAGFYKRQECDCILSVCNKCSWISMIRIEDATKARHFNEMIAMYEQDYNVEGLREDMFFEFGSVSGDFFEVTEYIRNQFRDKTSKFCIHTYAALRKEYILPCWCGFYGDGHICNCPIDYNPTGKNLRNFGEVVFKTIFKFGLTMYYNEMLLGTMIDDVIYVVWNCNKHRGHEIYRCKDCRKAYNDLISKRFIGTIETANVKRIMQRQGSDTDPEQKVFYALDAKGSDSCSPKPIPELSDTENEQPNPVQDSDSSDDLMSRLVDEFTEANPTKTKGPSIAQRVQGKWKGEFRKFKSYLTKEMTKSALGPFGEMITNGGATTIYKVVSVLLDALNDDSKLSLSKLNLYFQCLITDKYFKKLIRPFLELFLPEQFLDMFLGLDTILLQKVAKASTPRHLRSYDLALLIREGWVPVPKDSATSDIPKHTVFEKDGMYYVWVENTFKWGNYTLEAQGDNLIPSFLYDVVKRLCTVNLKEATQKLIFLNQTFNVFKTVKDFFKFILGCLPTFLKEYFISKTERVWMDMCKDGKEISKITALFDMMNERDIKGLAIHDMHFKPLLQMWNRINKVVARLTMEGSRLAKAANDWIRIKTPNFKRLIELYRPGNPREMEPLWFELVGASGIGKSSMMTALVSAVYGMDQQEAKDNTYTRGNTLHYDGYHNQKVFAYDDFDATTLEGLAHQQVVELFLLISNCAVPAPMASIADKGTELNPELVFTLSNSKVEMCSEVPHTAALMRRKAASFRVSSVGAPNFSDFSHLRFTKEKPHSIYTRKEQESICNCKRINGVCFKHLDDFHALNFIGFATYVKAALCKKKREHEKRKFEQHELQFKDLLKDIDFISQGTSDLDDESDDIFYEAEEVQDYLDRELYRGYDLKSVFKTGLEWVSTLSNYLVGISMGLAAISVSLVLTISSVTIINEYLRGNKEESYIIEIIQQSEGKTDRKPKQHMRLDGESISHLLTGLVKLRFEREQHSSRACGYVVGKKLYCNYHITGFDDDDDDEQFANLTIEWKGTEKTLQIMKRDVRKLRKFAKCAKHEGRYDCPYCMTSYNDIVEINLEHQNLVPFRTRLQYFMSSSESLPRYLDNVTMYSYRDGVLTGSSGTAQLNSVIMPNGSEKINFITLNTRSEVGDCGAVYIYKGRIIAMHFGFDIVGASALGQVIVREQLTPIEFEIPDVVQQGVVRRAFKSCTAIGVLNKAIHRSTKTDIKPSLIQNMLGERTTEPTILSKFDKRANGIDPFDEGVKKYDITGKVPDKFDYQEFSQILSATFFNDRKARMLTEFEAINGCEDFHLPPIDMTKSAGFGYNPSPNGKRSLFEYQDGKYYVKDLLLRKNIDDLLDSVNRGVAKLPISQATLKDERVKPGKRTRVFNNFPVEYTIVGRMFLGSFIGCAHSWYDRHSYFSIGINLYSKECNRFMNDCLRVSDLGFDGDYKDYDLSLPFSIVYAVYRAIEKWSGIDVRIPSLWFLHPLVVFDDEVHIQHDGNTSGNLMTTLVNSIAGFGLLWLAYINNVPPVLRDLKTFEAFVVIKTFGDDNLVIVARKILRYFNIKIVKDYLKTLGITYTRADKKDEGKEIIIPDGIFDDIEAGCETAEQLEVCGLKRINTEHTKLEFLKNTFRYYKGNWYALLRDSVITEMTYWVRSKTYHWTDLDDEAMMVNINTALRFRYFYGRKAFEEWREKFITALREVSVKRFNLLTYGEVHNQFTEYGFIPDLDNWTRENAEVMKENILINEKSFITQNLNMERQGIIDKIEEVLGDVLKPISSTVEPIAELAGTLGMDLLDNPTISNRSEATRIQSNSNLNQVVGVNRAILLASDQKACSRTPRDAHRMEQVHSMDQLINVPILRRGFTQGGVTFPTWSSSTPTPGIVLYTCPVGINPNLYVQATGGRALPMDVFGSLFDLWRGSICFEVSVAHTPFNKGVLALMFWDFQTDQAITFDLTALTNSALAQMTLSGHMTKATVEIPFRHQANRLKVYDGSPFDQCFIGTFAIVAMTPLLTKQGFPTEVPILVRSYAKNLELSYRSLNLISQYDEQDHEEMSPMQFFKNDLPPPEGFRGELMISRPMVRQGDNEPTSSEGESVSTHGVEASGAYTHMNSGTIMNAKRFGPEAMISKHIPIQASQAPWSIADFLRQSRVALQHSWSIPQTAFTAQGLVLPGAAMPDQAMMPCITANSRFFTYDSIEVRIQMNSMSGICGFFFVVNLPGITSVADALNYLDASPELVDANNGIVHSIVADEEIVMTIPYQYPLKMMSTDFNSPTSTLLVGFYTDTYIGSGQTGNLSIVVKTAVKGFKMVEPKAPFQIPLTMTRQGDNGDGVKADDAALLIDSNRAAPVQPRNNLNQVVVSTSEVENSDANVIQLVKANKPTKKIQENLRDRPDSVMSTELCKAYERVLNLDITNWTGQVFHIYDLISKHRMFALWSMMFRFFHGGFRFKIRVMPDTQINRAIRIGYRGMYGNPDNTDLLYQDQTIGHVDFATGFRSNRGAIGEFQLNTAGELLDIEVPYTWMGDTLTLAPHFNRHNQIGYDFGSLYIATNKTIASGVITIDVATSDDATFSCFTWLPIADVEYMWPNSFVEPVPPPLLNSSTTPPNSLNRHESEDSTDIEVVSHKSLPKEYRYATKKSMPKLHRV